MLEECAEEQALEIEALESIFEGDVSALSAEELRIRITPGDEVDHVSLLLGIWFPPNYPLECTPQMNVESAKGLTDSHLKHVMSIADLTAKDCCGTASIYMVVEAIRNWLRDNNEPLLTEHEQAVLRSNKSLYGLIEHVLDDECETEEKGSGLVSRDAAVIVQHGTRLFDVAEFMAWKEDFEARVLTAEAKEAESLRPSGGNNSTTGKEFFEKRARDGLVVADDVIDDDGAIFYLDASLYEQDL